MDILSEKYPDIIWRFSTNEEDIAGVDIFGSNGWTYQVKHQALALKTHRVSFELAVYNRFKQCWQYGNHFDGFSHYALTANGEYFAFTPKVVITAFMEWCEINNVTPDTFIKRLGPLKAGAILTELSPQTKQKQFQAGRAHVNAVNLCIPTATLVDFEKSVF